MDAPPKRKRKLARCNRNTCADKMSKTRTIHLRLDKVLEEVYVLGTELVMDIYHVAPPGAKTYSVSASADVTCWVSTPFRAAPSDARGRVAMGTQVHAQVLTPSQEVGDKKMSVTFYGDKPDVGLAKARLYMTAIGLSLDVDSDRDGIVEPNHPNKAAWTWGPNGSGAVLMVNCDKERSVSSAPDNEDNYLQSAEDLQDMSPMLVRTRGPAKLPPGYSLQLHSLESQYAGVFLVPDARAVTGPQRQSLGPGRPSFLFEYPGRGREVSLYVEGLSFPDADFSGYVHFHLSLLQDLLPGTPSTPIFTDSVVFRVAPWIMTPNTQPALEIFMTRVDTNAVFVKQMSSLALMAGCTAYEVQKTNDVWMQDEMEFGYCEHPKKVMPVVFDSPRDRGLKDVPPLLTGKDFGYVTCTPRRGEEVNSLDSFGNLEVSPPVIVKGKKYPLGRIIIGSAFPADRTGRQMARSVREFLFAQQVQAPIELYSDWLSVGHVDEFMSFVPAPDRKGFRLLLACPDACLRLLKELQEQGHGQRRLFESCPDVIAALKRKVKIQDILDDKNITTENSYIQRCIDWNRDVLKRELGLEETDIIDLPVLFFLNKKMAEAYFPDVVNMVVLNKQLGIPKPFWPQVGGECPLESRVRSLLQPLGLTCNFIDDLRTYHLNLGEVHCGSNTRRSPFAGVRWWDVGPL